MLQNLRKQQKGFTIIEVLIVLAIAGLILLIVFLAVPALQRNSRNTSIRNDAGAVLGGVSEFVSNNNGQLPTGIAPVGTDGTFRISGTGTTQANEIKIRPNITVGLNNAFPGQPNAINVSLNNKCTSNTALTPTQRAYAALFRVESGSGNNPTQCVDS